MDYRSALEQAILYIEDRLGEAITVEEVARAAGYSYYHLNRQWTTVTWGMTIRTRKSICIFRSNKRIGQWLY